MTVSIDVLRAGLLAGDQTAAKNLFAEFSGRLIALARSRMDQKLRQKVDAEDVVQSVYKSFFVRAADGQFEFDNWNNLWTILAVITLRKCGHRVEHFRAACRDVRREQIPVALNADESVASFQGIARDPMPSEVVALTETLEQIMRHLDAREQ